MLSRKLCSSIYVVDLLCPYCGTINSFRVGGQDDVGCGVLKKGLHLLARVGVTALDHLAMFGDALLYSTSDLTANWLIYSGHSFGLLSPPFLHTQKHPLWLSDLVL